MKNLIVIGLFLGLLSVYNISVAENLEAVEDEEISEANKTNSATQLAAPTTSTAPAATTTTVLHCLDLAGSMDTCYFDANHIERHPAPNGIQLCVPNTCR